MVQSRCVAVAGFSDHSGPQIRRILERELRNTGIRLKPSRRGMLVRRVVRVRVRVSSLVRKVRVSS